VSLDDIDFESLRDGDDEDDENLQFAVVLLHDIIKNGVEEPPILYFDEALNKYKIMSGYMRLTAYAYIYNVFEDYHKTKNAGDLEDLKDCMNTYYSNFDDEFVEDGIDFLARHAYNTALVLITSTAPTDITLSQLKANVFRKDISVEEKGQAMKAIIARTNMSQRALSTYLGVSKEQVSDLVFYVSEMGIAIREKYPDSSPDETRQIGHILKSSLKYPVTNEYIKEKKGQHITRAEIEEKREMDKLLVKPEAHNKKSLPALVGTGKEQDRRSATIATSISEMERIAGSAAYKKLLAMVAQFDDKIILKFETDIITVVAMHKLVNNKTLDISRVGVLSFQKIISKVMSD
jgi:hypothetical protein